MKFFLGVQFGGNSQLTGGAFGIELDHKHTRTLWSITCSSKSPATKSSHVKLGDYVHHVDGLCVCIKKSEKIYNNSNKPTKIELCNRNQAFLPAKLQKPTISFLISLCPSMWNNIWVFF